MADPSLLHKVVHVLVFNDAGNLLLQKRSMNKDVAPGKWDTSVGGHVSPGEDLKTAALREMKEELGVIPEDIEPLYSYISFGFTGKGTCFYLSLQAQRSIPV